ncbi:MAG: sigma-70 family RNA polymerase sigma factor [Opitutaceae bacterium]|nr:sigma-70 family RNA polymerase sigma factor [Opitutaceae bacterium]
MARPPTVSEETDLLLRVAQRDEAAFAALYDRLAPLLFGLVLRILRSKVEAEDVLQEAFWQIWEHAPSYRPDLGTPFCWTVTLARHKAIDRLRSNHRHRDRMAEAQAEAAPELVDDPLGPSLLASAEVRQAVRLAVGGLPLNQRRPIELAFFDGLTQQEIADGLGLPLGTVKARIRRGLLKLQIPLNPMRAHG